MPWLNGLYQATTFSGPSYTMMLRVDLDPGPRYESYVSLDLYRGYLGPDTSPDLAATLVA